MFEKHMRIAWSPVKEVKFQHLEENLFSVQCFCLGDWIKVEKGVRGCFDKTLSALRNMMDWHP
jgi:hypothetical protein